MSEAALQAQKTNPYLIVTRFSLYALLVFSPLALAAVQGWAITAIHLLTLIALTAFLMEKTTTWNWEWIKTPLDRPIILLLILCLFSVFFSLNKRTSFYAFLLLLNYLVIYYLLIHTVRTRTQFRQLVYLIGGIAAFMAVFGLIKNFMANPFSWWNYPEIYKNEYRVTGTFVNANNFAGYMEMAIPLLIGMLLTGIRKTKMIVVICLLFLCLMALVFSFSRGGWISMMMGFFFMVIALVTNRYINKKRLLMWLTCGFLAACLFVLANTGMVKRIASLKHGVDITNFRGRVTAWSGVLDMIRDHPFLGDWSGNLFFCLHPIPASGHHSYSALLQSA